MTDYALAANFIEQFEGYTPLAKWDVNAYRLGYGSDTEGPDQVKVTKGMVTTRERAFENLEARIPAFEKVIIGQVGATAWDKLPAQAQAALLSMAYNYGDLPADVANAVRVGDSLPHIASAVEAHEGDNRGVNSARRLKEAQDILSAKASDPAIPGSTAPPEPVKAEPTADVAKLPAEPPAPPPLDKVAPGASLNPAPIAPVDVHTFAGIQEALNLLLPAEPLLVDGNYGAKTVAKMKAFQASKGLRETGDSSFFSALAVYQALQKAGIPTVNPT